VVKKILFLLCFVFSGPLAQAQIPYLNYQAHLGSSTNSAYAVEALTDGYIISGQFVQNGSQGLFFHKLDDQGNNIYTKTILDSALTYFSVSYGSLVTLPDGGFISAGAVQNDTLVSAFLVRYNVNGDTVFTRTYSDSIGRLKGFYTVNTCDDGGFILAGRIDNPTHADGILMKLDSNGNLEWENTFGGSGNEVFVSVKELSSGEFIVGSSTRTDCGADADPQVLRFDAVGNELWSQCYNGDDNDGQAQILESNDGGFYISTSRGTCINGCSLATLIKIDANGSTVWEANFGNNQSFSAFFKALELSDGSIVAAGLNNQNGHYCNGILAKLTPDGDTLWKRDYNLLMDTSSLHYITDMVQTPNGGFLMVGYVTPQGSDTGTNSTWIVAVDSAGCEVANGCLVGIGESQSVVDNMAIFPNPANETVIIDLGIETAGTVSFIDMLGRLVIRTSTAPELGRLEVNVAELPIGVYTVLVTDAAGNSNSKKLVVNR